METEQAQIVDFMSKAGQATPATPCVPDLETRLLRVKLIAEELCELAVAYGINLKVDSTQPKHSPEQIQMTEGTPFSSDPVDVLTEAYDATVDLLVVTVGNGVACGTPIAPGWEEVHRSNMTKFIDGHRRPDGKWVKGPSYSPAQLRPLVEQMLSTSSTQAP